ncbi:MAG: efflux RND transporter permease subunit [Acidobacteria bacterium]|nr:efflux RND transporter permease subunit [Acidobacteriota bacterium]
MSGVTRKGETFLSRFSLHRRVTVLMLVLTTLVVGAVALNGLPVELIPRNFTDQSLAVIVPWNDAPPGEVDEKITVPLQEELATVRGLSNIVSVSLTRGSRVFMSFKSDTDMDVAYREVRDRIERARRNFPTDVDQIFIRKDDASGIPVVVVGVAIDDDLVNSYDLLQNEIILPLERVDGVASVQANGLEEKEILIELDRRQVEAAGLNLYTLAQDLGSDNFTLASGDVRDGDRQLMLRSVARFRTLDEIRQRPVSPTVRLGDIARITFDEPDKQYRVRAMSQPAYAILTFKEGDANAREVAVRVREVLASFADNPRLAGVQVITLFDQGQVIDSSIGSLGSSGMIGGVLACLVLFVFLRRLRLTLVISLSIPLSLLIAMTVMYFAGETLNIITLLALMVCIGLLVDNSVVVAENIHRLRQSGLSRRDACINGAGEIALAITMSTLTTVVVFAPVALMGSGPAQFIFMRLALPISVALLASLALALVVMPLAVFLTLSPAGSKHREQPLLRPYRWLVAGLRWLYAQSFDRLGRSYIRVLDFFLVRRLDMMFALLALFVLTGAVSSSNNLRFVAIQEDERSGFEISVQMPENTTLQETEEWFLAAEAQVESHAPELGLEGWFLFHRKTFGEIQGWFTTPRSTDLSPREVTEKILELLPPKPGMNLFTGQERQLGDTRDDAISVITLQGEDSELLEQTASNLEDVLARVDGVLGVQRNQERTPNEIGLVIDRERSRQYNVNPRVVAGVVEYALRGISLPKFLDEGTEVPVRVRFREEDRVGMAELASFRVPAGDDGYLPLSSVTSVTMLSVPEAIVRRNKQIARTITLDLQEGTEEETRERLTAIMAGVDLPEGVSLGTSTQGVQGDEDLQRIMFAGLLSVVFIYLLMGFLFESFILPLSIILTIPLSSLGVIWAHVLTGRNIDFLGAVGIVLLIGVVVNNGIVLIDYVNRLRGDGMARSAALLLAAERRFRPIMMTAITTIGGLIPLALGGRGDAGLSYTSFSLTLIGGMSTATILTLLVIPIFYTFFDDLRATSAAAIGRLKGLSKNLRRVDSLTEQG